MRMRSGACPAALLGLLLCLPAAASAQEQTRDQDCINAVGVGGEPVVHTNDCNCECVELGGRIGKPGSLECEIGLSTVLELDPPCGDGDVSQLISAMCVPFTTGVFSNTQLDVNEDGGTIGPEVRVGDSAACAALASGQAAGLELTGNAGSFDTRLGDLSIPNTFICK